LTAAKDEGRQSKGCRKGKSRQREEQGEGVEQVMCPLANEIVTTYPASKETG